MFNWIAMLSAPKDGTWLILLYEDCSGVVLARWEQEAGGVDGPGWYSPEDFVCGPFAGWIPAPSIPRP